ncbi:MAG: type IV pilin protein [Gammaproteobacteria bacterium]|nr:type IV pilin protein [Gammaproteobacteria bacterium]
MKIHQWTHKQKTSGFTLMELMVTVAIVGILAAVALPRYRSSVLRSARSEGKSALLEAATRQEQYYLDNKTYTAVMTDLGLSASPYITEGGNYSVSAAASTGKTIATSYTLTAAPQGGQADDTHCGSLTLNSNGVKGAASTDCW